MNQIKQFQLKNGLIADGILGKKTVAKIMEVLQIDSNESLAHFLGQTAHETGNFSVSEENLNYSSKGLLKTFPKYFKTEADAVRYANQPEKIANRVYAERMSNGSELSGDGFKFRGRGALQLTGKSNYKLFSDYVGDDCVSRPELVSEKYFFESAKFFFDNNKLWNLAKTVDEASITAVSKRVNGSTNGLQDRISKTRHFYQLINQ